MTDESREKLELIIVDFNDTFVRHRVDVSMKTQFKVSLSPKNDKSVYKQSLPIPINLKVELAQMHRYGMLTTFPFSEYAKSMFEQRKPNRKLRLLVNIRKINAPISNDYINNDHHLSTNSGAELLPGKNLHY